MATVSPYSSKQVTVSAGDVIATAGDSGGQPQSGIYFEIRSRGKPVNPAKWCTSKISHAANDS